MSIAEHKVAPVFGTADFSTDQGMAVVTLTGEFDAYTTETLRKTFAQAVIEAPRPRMAVEASGVTFFDSGALGCLIWAWKRLKEVNGVMCLAAPSERMMQPIRITGLTRIFEAFPTIEEALTWLAER